LYGGLVVVVGLEEICDAGVLLDLGVIDSFLEGVEISRLLGD
jgi:hypothetical protein